jgi:Cys-rich protein (TIGR01571 family)
MAQPWTSDIFLFTLRIDILFSYFSIFSVELFGCFDDIDETCLLGSFFPCYLFGENAEQIDGSNKWAMCCGYALLSNCYLICLLHKPEREKLRAVYNLEEKPNDILTTCCCSPCANCQEAKEMRVRG